MQIINSNFKFRGKTTRELLKKKDISFSKESNNWIILD